MSEFAVGKDPPVPLSPQPASFPDLSCIPILLVRLTFTSAHVAGFWPLLGTNLPKERFCQTQQNGSKAHLGLLARNESLEQWFRNRLGFNFSASL